MGSSSQVLGLLLLVLDSSLWGFGLMNRIVNTKNLVGGMKCDARVRGER